MFWRIIKFLTGLVFLVTGCMSFMYVMNDTVAGYQSGQVYKNQELFGTGILAGLGFLLIISSLFGKKTIEHDEE